MLLSRVQAAEDAAGGIDWDVSVDSTAVRAHQHAAGARKAPPAALPQKGAEQGTNQVDPVLRKLVARLEEVVRSANAWDVPEGDSPPRSTWPPRGDAGPSPSS
ncbi:transposase [Streptomyces sp. PAMC 26508]|nr:transposase [Streptomyces sp. PAMC 26508]